jgi:hypothetical protein
MSSVDILHWQSTLFQISYNTIVVFVVVVVGDVCLMSVTNNANLMIVDLVGLV